jgi:hypothetical protein
MECFFLETPCLFDSNAAPDTGPCVKCINIDSQKALHPEERLGKGRWPIALKPKCSPIPQEQLASEIKGIHAGLVMVEAKCINIDSQTALHSEERLGTEHHDFLIATQHPFSNLAPLRLI